MHSTREIEREQHDISSWYKNFYLRRSMFDCSNIGDILCIVENENYCINIARWIILFALCVDVRLTLSLHH